ncbi:MAG TPA: OsmC family protein [Vicinamibacteria bacterium]|nr:OsmC family protein [Vicinamibacteria bacterium]
MATTGRDAARAFVRGTAFELGVPLGFDREAPSISAMEYALGAVGGELVVGFQRAARRRRLEVDTVEATVEARLENALVHLLVVGETGEPAMQALSARLYVTSPAEPEALRAAWDEVLRTSPLLATLRRAAVDLDLTLKPLA